MKRFQPTSKSDKIVITIRIEDFRVEQLDRLANEINISRNELISQCLDFEKKNKTPKK